MSLASLKKKVPISSFFDTAVNLWRYLISDCIIQKDTRVINTYIT